MTSVEPIKLPHGGKLVIPRRPGLTDQSPLPIDGVIGSHHGHHGPVCNGGVFHFHALAIGWTVICNRCGIHFELPDNEGGRVPTYDDLRAVTEAECAEQESGRDE